jgi:hypothetical protein
MDYGLHVEISSHFSSLLQKKGVSQFVFIVCSTILSFSMEDVVGYNRRNKVGILFPLRLIGPINCTTVKRVTVYFSQTAITSPGVSPIRDGPVPATGRIPINKYHCL